MPPRILRLTFALGLLVTFITSSHANSYNVGFKRVHLDDPMSSTSSGVMQVSIWYPTGEATDELRLGPFSFKANRNAIPVPGSHPLVVMSHGNGGSDLGHRNVAIELAKRGIITVAPLHPRNNYRDNSGAGKAVVMEGRPRQILAVIEALMDGEVPELSVDRHHVGGFGFSLGGYTMLSVMGAKPEMKLIPRSCAIYPTDPACLIANQVKQSTSKGELLMSDHSLSDDRLCAAVVVDPVAFIFSDDSLQSITTEYVQLWKPEFDNALLAEAHIDRVTKALNARSGKELAEVTTVPKAQHYSFLAPFPGSISLGLPKELTQDHTNFNCVKFQEKFATEVAEFLAVSLQKCRDSATD